MNLGCMKSVLECGGGCRQATNHVPQPGVGASSPGIFLFVTFCATLLATIS